MIKHAKIVNVFTKEIMEKDVAICEGMIVGIGEYEGKSVHNANGQYLCQDSSMAMCISKAHFYHQANFQKYPCFMELLL